MIDVVEDYRMVGGGEIRGYPGWLSDRCGRGLQNGGWRGDQELPGVAE